MAKDNKTSGGASSSIHSSVARRDFLKAGSLAALGGALVPGLLMGETPITGGAVVSNPDKCSYLLGALFNPYYHPSDWNYLVGRQLEHMPLLGSYGSSEIGTIATQIIWAKEMGLTHFIATCLPRKLSDSRYLDNLFTAADRHDFNLGLCLDLRKATAAHGGSSSEEESLMAAVDPIQQYIRHRCYLRSPQGATILGLITDDRQILGPLADRHFGDSTVLCFPGSWAWIPQTYDEIALAEYAQESDLYLGFSSARSSSPPLVKRIPCESAESDHSWSAFMVIPNREILHDGPAITPKLRLPRVHAGDLSHCHLILDAFNNWGISVPLEPSIRYGEKYVSQVAGWSRSLGKAA